MTSSSETSQSSQTKSENISEVLQKPVEQVSTWLKVEKGTALLICACTSLYLNFVSFYHEHVLKTIVSFLGFFEASKLIMDMDKIKSSSYLQNKWLILGIELAFGLIGAALVWFWKQGSSYIAAATSGVLIGTIIKWDEYSNAPSWLVWTIIIVLSLLLAVLVVRYKKIILIMGASIGSSYLLFHCIYFGMTLRNKGLEWKPEGKQEVGVLLGCIAYGLIGFVVQWRWANMRARRERMDEERIVGTKRYTSTS